MVSADLSRVVAIVPVRGLETAKTRLGEALDAEERRDLVAELLERTIGAAHEAGLDVLVVSPDPEALAVARAVGAAGVLQGDGDLNEGLDLARARAASHGASAILALAADLPAITAAAIAGVVRSGQRALQADRAIVVLAPDRHGRGTNALLLSPPGAIDFSFGPDSRSRHLALAEAAGAVAVEVADGPLELDVDTVEDLVLAEPYLLWDGNARRPSG